MSPLLWNVGPSVLQAIMGRRLGLNYHNTFRIIKTKLVNCFRKRGWLKDIELDVRSLVKTSEKCMELLITENTRKPIKKTWLYFNTKQFNYYLMLTRSLVNKGTISFFDCCPFVIKYGILKIPSNDTDDKSKLYN